MLFLSKRRAEMCLNILFQRIQLLFIDFQRNQHEPYIISAQLADLLQKYPLAAADPSTRHTENRITQKSTRTVH